MSNKPKPKVIYICADVRSGSTLIDMILSQHSEITSIGEGHHLHDYLNDQYFNYKTKESHCTCGKNFFECEFWKGVVAEYQKEENLKDSLTKYSRPSRKINRFFHDLFNILLPSFLVRFLSSKVTYYKEAKNTTYTRFKLYDIINKLQNVQYVIDSSKWPEATKFYKTWFKKEARFLFIERDLRAISYSKYTRRPERGNVRVAFKDSVKTKILIKWYKRILPKSSFITVDYRRFTQNPSKELKRIGDFLDLQDCDRLLKTENFKEKHNLGGSPHRFTTKININTDERWRKDEKVISNLKQYWLYKLIY